MLECEGMSELEERRPDATAQSRMEPVFTPVDELARNRRSAGVDGVRCLTPGSKKARVGAGS